MKKRIAIMGVMIAIALMTACGNNGAEQTMESGQAGENNKKTADAEPLSLITSTSQLPGASTQLLQEKMTEVFDKEGAGAFSFEHYDSATLFKSSAELGALLDGNIDVGFVQMGYFYDNGALWANMYDIAFLYEDVEHMMKALDTEGEVGKWIQEQIWNEFHIRVVAPFYLGSRNVWMSEDKKVNTPQDLNGIKIRMPNSASFLEMGTAIGAEPTPLDSSETYLAMQTGTVDAQENIILSSWANAMQEVTKTIVMTEHMITPNYVCVNGDVWEAMTAEQQELFTKLVKQAVKENNETVMAEEEKILKACQDEFGITLQEPDKGAFREYAMDFYLSSEANVSNWNMDMYENVLKMAE